MTDPGKTGAPDRHVWDDYNHRQEFEHALIDRKTTWLLATQAILVAGYGVTFDSSNAAQGVDGFRDVVAWLGISVAGIVFVGVFCIVVSKWRAWREYARYFGEPDTPELPLGGKTLKWGWQLEHPGYAGPRSATSARIHHRVVRHLLLNGVQSASRKAPAIAVRERHSALDVKAVAAKSGLESAEQQLA